MRLFVDTSVWSLALRRDDAPTAPQVSVGSRGTDMALFAGTRLPGASAGASVPPPPELAIEYVADKMSIPMPNGGIIEIVALAYDLEINDTVVICVTLGIPPIVCVCVVTTFSRSTGIGATPDRTSIPHLSTVPLVAIL